MEGYTVISSKRVSISDFKDEAQDLLSIDSWLLTEEDVDQSSSPINLLERHSSYHIAPDNGEVAEVVEILSDDDNEATIHNENNNNDVEKLPYNVDFSFLNDIPNCNAREEENGEILGYLTSNDAKESQDEPKVIFNYENSNEFSSSNDDDDDDDDDDAEEEPEEFENEFTSCSAPIRSSQLLCQMRANYNECFTTTSTLSPTPSSEATTVELTNNTHNSTQEEDDVEIIQDSDTDVASESEESPQSDICRRSAKVGSQYSLDNYIYFMCPQCGINCGTIEQWRLHTDTQHAFGMFETTNMQRITNRQGKLCLKCGDCEKMFKITTGFSILINHRIRHLPFEYFMGCRYCDKKYRTRMSVRTHILVKHKEYNITIRERERDTALDHIRLFCTVCKEEKPNMSEWKSHMTVAHDYFNNAIKKYDFVSADTFTCKICNGRVRTKSLSQHMLTHEKFKSFQCTFCNSYMAQIKACKYHVRTKHLRNGKELSYKCTLCLAEFPSLSTRRKHYKEMHKIVRPKCNVCRRSFSSTSMLLAHMNTNNHMPTTKPMPTGEK